MPLRYVALGWSLALALILAPAAWSSQSPAHVYIALQAAQGASPAVKAIIDAAPDAYCAGAAGPDTAYTSNYIRVGLGGSPPGTESHEKKTGELTCNLLRLAKTPQEKAYALGWLSHWETDNLIHALVNKYGGLYTTDEKRHKLLEMMECEHVFSKYVGATVPNTYIPLAAVTPRVLINAAYAATFPTGGNSAAYKPYTVIPHNSSVAVTMPPVFIDNLATGADNMETVCRSWVEMHNTGTYTGLWAWAENAVAVKGPPPTKEEYAKLMQPLVIDNVEALPPPPGSPFGAPGKLKISYTVNDARLLAEFCKAWDKVKDTAAGTVAGYMNRWAANPGGFSLPNTDLNVGYRAFDPSDKAMAWPGGPDIGEMLTFIKLKDTQGREMRLFGPGAGGWDPAGEWLPCDVVKQTWAQWFGATEDHAVRTKIWGGKAGSSYFEIPFEYSGTPGQIEVKIQFADKQDKKPYGPEAVWMGNKKPELSILFLVDTSGSMDGGKLEAAKAAVKEAVNKTNDGKTEWALARFGSCSVSVVCRFTTNATALATAADRLSAGGDTPMTYGRNLALEYLITSGQGKQGRLVLLCDGQDNCTERGSAGEPEAAASLRTLMQTVTTAATAGSSMGARP